MVEKLDKDIFCAMVADMQWSSELTQEKIDAWIVKYPAFQSAYLLKAALLQQKNEQSLQNQLPNLAARVADRSKLYDIVHEGNKWIVESTAEEKEATVVENSTVEVEEENPVEVVPVIVKTEEPVVEDTMVSEAEETIIDNEIASILDEAAEVKETTPVEEIKPTIEQEEIPVEKNTAIVEEEIQKTKEVVDEIVIEDEIPVIPEKKEEVQEESAISFADWLKNKKPIVVEEVKKEEKSIVEEEEPIPIEPSSQIEAELILEGKKSTNKLDSFIQGQILNKRKRNSTKKTLKTFEKKDLVSETYAQILVIQKKYLEAVATYETLSLKYPQKSTYFARQIENIKTHI